MLLEWFTFYGDRCDAAEQTQHCCFFSPTKALYFSERNAAFPLFHIKTVEDAVVFTCMTFAKTFDIRPVTITKTLSVGWCFVQEIIAINNITVILRPTLCHWCNDNILATGTVFGNPQTTTRVTNGDFPSRVKQLIPEHDLWRRVTPEATTPAFSPWHVFLS